jgi:uridine kinase
MQRAPVKSLLVGVSGGSGSGKTTFSKLLSEALGPDHCALLAQDSYYIDQSAHFRGDGENVNFDHPSALDFPLLAHHLAQLKQGQDIQVPIYDFVTHTRRAETTRMDSRPVILLDGTLILSQPPIRSLLDYSLFIQTSEQVRFDRRYHRDLVERGRQPDGIRKQFYRQVKPMHDEFVEPSLEFASAIISGERDFSQDVHAWVSRLKASF